MLLVNKTQVINIKGGDYMKKFKIKADFLGFKLWITYEK